MKAKRVAAAAPAMKAMKAKRVAAAAPAMKAMKAKVVGGCAGGGCVVYACQSTSLLVTGRRCSLGAARPGHPPSRSRGCSSEGSCCTQRFGISCECGRKKKKKRPLGDHRPPWHLTSRCRRPLDAAEALRVCADRFGLDVSGRVHLDAGAVGIR